VIKHKNGVGNNTTPFLFFPRVTRIFSINRDKTSEVFVVQTSEVLASPQNIEMIE